MRTLAIALFCVSTTTAAEPATRLTLKSHEYGVNAVAVGGNVLASSDGIRSATIKLWDANTGRELRTIETRFGIRLAALAVTPDGKSVVATDYCGQTKVWEVASGEEQKKTFSFGSALAPLQF